MEKGYYISAIKSDEHKESKEGIIDCLDAVVSELEGIGAEGIKAFPSIGRVYALLSDDTASKLSEKYSVEPEPEKGVWI